MKKTLATLTAGGLLVATLAASHQGATGIVRERMDGMVAMRDTVRDLTPMMRGRTEYAREAVLDAAAALERHAGETMTALFPEGSDDAASYARAEIWQDWETFEAMAMRMEVVAGALAEAADDTPEQLRINVTSPNGTTQAGLEVLMAEDGLMPLMRATVAAAAGRSRELKA